VRSLRAWAEASWSDRALVVEATIFLALARLALLCLPFRVIARRLGQHTEQTPVADDPHRVRIGRRITWAIDAASVRAPWRTRCLEQALAGKAMLRRRRIPSTLYLGVARGTVDGRPLDAHAWVRMGTLLVTGGGQVERYTVLSSFADAAR
jgi:hypothetical protein